MPQSIPFPCFLLDMDLSQTAKLVYAVLLYRANLSKKNGWIDEQGRVYIIYPVTAIAETLHKGVSVIKEALSALDSAGLTERKRNFSAPDTIYVKLPADSRKTGQVIDEEPATSEPENHPIDSRETGQRTAGKPATRIKNKNKDREKDTDNMQPVAAVSVARTPLDVFLMFAQEQAPGNTELLEALKEFDDTRKGIAHVNRKKPWTVSAAKGICKRLVQLTDEAGVKDRTGYMCACLDSSNAAGWLSVYPYEHFTDHSPVVRDPAASLERLHRSLSRKNAPDQPRHITKDMPLDELIMGGGIPAAQKEGDSHE